MIEAILPRRRIIPAAGESTHLRRVMVNLMTLFRFVNDKSIFSRRHGLLKVLVPGSIKHMFVFPKQNTS